MNQLERPRHIFIVDDEPAIADTTAQILQREGFHCVPFSNPTLLLEHCSSNPPDLVISDIIMPQMSGFDLAIQLLAMQLDCEILLFTGHAGVDNIREYASELGLGSEVLAKPLDPKKLIEKVHDILRVQSIARKR